MLGSLRFAAPSLLLMAATSAVAADDPPRPRQGLTAIQTQQAVKIAAGSLGELRQKAPEANKPNSDRREFVVSVERLSEKTAAAEKADAPTKAVVTTYRYLDDTTIYATVDLASGRTIDVATAQHMQTPLSDGEFEAAKALARERSDEVKALYDRFGRRIDVYAQFSQYTPDGDDRVHRVVVILYRVDKRDLSAPRPVVDLTTRQVMIPKPDAEEVEKGEARPRPARP